MSELPIKTKVLNSIKENVRYLTEVNYIKEYSEFEAHIFLLACVDRIMDQEFEHVPSEGQERYKRWCENMIELIIGLLWNESENFDKDLNFNSKIDDFYNFINERITFYKENLEFMYSGGKRILPIGIITAIYLSPLQEIYSEEIRNYNRGGTGNFSNETVLIATNFIENMAKFFRGFAADIEEILF